MSNEKRKSGSQGIGQKSGKKRGSTKNTESGGRERRKSGKII